MKQYIVNESSNEVVTINTRRRMDGSGKYRTVIFNTLNNIIKKVSSPNAGIAYCISNGLNYTVDTKFC